MQLGDPERALAVLQTAYDKCPTDDLRAAFTEKMNALQEGGAQ